MTQLDLDTNFEQEWVCNGVLFRTPDGDAICQKITHVSSLLLCIYIVGFFSVRAKVPTEQL